MHLYVSYMFIVILQTGYFTWLIYRHVREDTGWKDKSGMGGQVRPPAWPPQLPALPPLTINGKMMKPGRRKWMPNRQVLYICKIPFILLFKRPRVLLCWK